MRLFDNFIRTDFSYSSHSESTYEFYNRAALPQFVAVRERLENWFSAYPDDAKFEQKRKFEKEFDSAYYELFLYILFLENGYSVELHADVAASGKKPDMIVNKGEFSAYVEARVVHEVSVDEANVRNIRKRIYDKINEIQSDYFHIGINELEILDMSKAPSQREINVFISNALNQVDYQVLLNRIQQNNNSSLGVLPRFSLETSTVKLIISVLPKSTPSIGKPSTLIAFYAAEGKAQMVNPSAALTKALKEKGKRYGLLDKPFIIAINALSTWVTYEEDYTIALFGNETLNFDPTNKVYLSAQGSDGFFINAKGLTYSRVSGVLFTKAYHSSVSGSRLIYYHNPGATRPINYDFLAIKQMWIDEGKINTIEGRSTASLFNTDTDEHTYTS